MNARLALLAFLLPAACSAPPPTAPAAKAVPAASPEELFQRMERRLVSVPSLRLRGMCEQIDRQATGVEERKVVTMAAFLRGGEQCSVEMKGKDAEGQPVGAALICDGTFLLSRMGFTKPWTPRAVLPELKTTLLTMIHRFGLAYGTLNLNMHLALGRTPQVSGMPEPSNLRAGETTPEGVPSLTYDLADQAGRTVSATLWYDARTLRPVRRRIGPPEGKPGTTFDETYSDFAEGAELPNERFVLPDLDPEGRQRFAYDGQSMIYEERQDGDVRFVLIADGGTVAEASDEGLVLKRGGVTQKIRNNTGLMLLKGNRTLMNAIPEGWDHDLVQEFHEYRAAHAGARISEWLAAAVKKRPSAMIETYLKKD